MYRYWAMLKLLVMVGMLSSLYLEVRYTLVFN